MRKNGRRGFTLVELLIVIIIIGLLAALLLPAIVKALCTARQGAAEHLIDNLSQATKSYELDQNGYPPGDGSDTVDLAVCLSVQGPKKLAYYVFLPDMLDQTTGSILNPVSPSSDDDVARLIYYRNNVTGSGTGGVPGGGGGGAGPAVRFADSFDMWCADCNYQGGGSGDPSSYGVNNWE